MTRQDPKCTDGSTSVAKSTMVWYDVENAGWLSTTLTQPQKYSTYADFTLGLKYMAPEFRQLKNAFYRAVWHKHSDRGISPQVTQKFLNGFNITTQHNYSVQTKLWYLFCAPRKIDPLRLSLTELTEHFAEESTRDAIVSKVVLRWILHGDHTYLLDNKEITAFCDKRWYKPSGAPNPQITTEYVWDKDMVIDYYKKIKPNKLSLMALTEKCVILTLLTTGCHPSELRRLSLSALTVTGSGLNFIVPKTKTSRWNKVEDVTFCVELLKSGVKQKPAVRRVCPYHCIQQYIKATQGL